MSPKPLSEAVHDLLDVLERENAALAAMNFAHAAALSREKTEAVAGLMEAGEAAIGLPYPGLVSMAERLDHVVRENRRLLTRAIATQQRVIGIVLGAATTTTEQSYGSASRSGCHGGPISLSTQA